MTDFKVISDQLAALDLRTEAAEAQLKRIADALEKVVSLMEPHAEADVTNREAPRTSLHVVDARDRAREDAIEVRDAPSSEVNRTSPPSPPSRLDLVAVNDVRQDWRRGPPEPQGQEVEPTDARARTQGSAHGVSNLLYYAVAPTVVRRLLRDERSIRHGLLTTTIDAETGMPRERRTRVLERLHKEEGFVETTMVKKGQPAIVRITDVDRARAWLATYGARAEG